MFSVQPTNLDDIVTAEFEKKSIIPDSGLKNAATADIYIAPHWLLFHIFF